MSQRKESEKKVNLPETSQREQHGHQTEAQRKEMKKKQKELEKAQKEEKKRQKKLKKKSGNASSSDDDTYVEVLMECL
ncbi:uncharacterized protein LOC127356257 [Dicentrarchus labrax]|uniref:uncharacterized protein LOC127356257 n=1 Tax=Dicentrarchus labrax TaxID=13489 RepID=UPI0021F57F14|nr:uncharacterized protein LOC127356257 [Dicentrarchus labrax]